jgi:hypothetical protein
MSDGMEVASDIHVLVLQNKLSSAIIREAQLEAAVQQLIMENNDLKLQLAETGEADASSDR